MVAPLSAPAQAAEPQSASSTPASSDATAAKVTAPQERGVVVGRVVDESGAPVRDILVEALSGASGSSTVVASDYTSSFSQEDDNHERTGGYRLELPPGDYTLRITDELRNVVQVYGTSGPQVVSVAARAYVELADTRIPTAPAARTTSLTGRLVDAAGAAVANRDVYLYLVRPGQRFEFTGYSESSSTGGFSFDKAPVGRQLLVCSFTSQYDTVCGSGHRGLEGAAPFAIPQDANGYALPQPVVDPTVEVTVPVRGTKGQSVPATYAYLAGDGRFYTQPGTSPSSFLAKGVFPGSYTSCSYAFYDLACLGGVQSEAAGTRFTVPSGVTTFTAPTLTLPIGGSFTGSVVDTSGRPVGNATIELWQKTSAPSESPTYSGLPSVKSRPDGTFVAPYGGAGDYSICVYLGGTAVRTCVGAPAGTSDFGSTVVTAQDQDKAIGAITVPVPVILSGRIVDAAGQPAPYHYVQVYSQPRDGDTDYASYRAFEDGNATGTYSIPIFPDGRPVTVCSYEYVYRSSEVTCLGGYSGTREPGTADTSAFVALNTTTNATTAPDLRLPTTESTRCRSNSTGSYGGAALDNGTLTWALGCSGEALAYVPDFGEDGYGAQVGLRLGNRADVLARGCACEGWGVADARSGARGWVSADLGSSGVLSQTFRLRPAQAMASSTVVAGTDSYSQDQTFRVTHETLPSSDPRAALVRVSITNISNNAVDLRYRRTIDWDASPSFDDIITTRGAGVPELAFTSNDGFASPDPLAPRSTRGAVGDVTRYGPKDQGTLLDFEFGELLSGATRSFTLAFGAANSQPEAEGVIAAINAKAYSMATSTAPGDDVSYFVAYGVADSGGQQLPSAVTDDAKIASGQSVLVDVLANDVANATGSLTVVRNTAASHGSVACDTRACTYTHNGDSATSDSFEYTVRNSAGKEATGRVRIAIEAAPTVADLGTAPVLAKTTGLVTGSTLTVTPATYSAKRAEYTRTFDWFATFGTGPSASTYRFASGPDTSVTLPNWIEQSTVQVEETISAAGYKSLRTKSNVTDNVQGLAYLYPAGNPVFDATPQVGSPTTASAIAWQEWRASTYVAVTGVDTSFEWYVNGELLSGADSRLSMGGDVFTPRPSDAGSWVYAVVTGTKDGYAPGMTSVYAPRIRAAGESFKKVRVQLTDPRPAPDGGPVEATVTICSAETGSCFWANARDGGYEAEVPSSTDGVGYLVHVYPYDAGLLTTTKPATVRNDGTGTVGITLETIKPKPPQVAFPTEQPTRGTGADAVPMGFIGRPMTFTLDNCAPMATGKTATWKVEFASGATPMTGTITKITPGTTQGRSTYEVEIPPLTSSGSSTVSTNVDCGAQVVEFTIYIDPSGIVTDQFGRPIPGAEVTLLKQNGAGGPFLPVANGNVDVMDPDVNSSNPSLTDDTGFFRWDVTDGSYQVSLTKARSGGASCDLYTTPSMSVPPERVDLIIKAQCTGASTPTPTTAPEVTGTRAVGSTLSISTGTWRNGIVQTGIQWLRDGNTIAGATQPTYTLTKDDAGTTTTARVTAQRPNYVQENGSGAVVSFAAFDTVANGGGLVPAAGGGGGGGGGGTTTSISNTAKPSITGTAKVAGALTANPGTWSTDGLTFVYQWLRDGAPIVGATGTSYSPAVGDLAKAISVSVTATKTGLTPGTASSDSVTIAKGAAAESLSRPLVTGDAEPGATLTVSDGTWDLQGLTFGYQWLRDGTAIEGATSSTYVVDEADRGSELSARVTAAKTAHEDGSATSSGVTVPEAPDEVTPAASTTKATILGNKIGKGERGEVRVKVTSEGDAVPTGTVTVTVGDKSVEVELTMADGGRVKVTLPKLKPGTYAVSVDYSGDDLTEPSSDDAGKIKVKEKGGKKGKSKGERSSSARIGGPLLTA
jgi:protocatechuate 3,4-dioxygenase beta subunit